MSQEYTPPAFITIRAPMQIDRARGVYATTTLASPLKVRISELDAKLLREEAAALNMTVSNFVRWTALQTARELRKYRDGTDVPVEL